MIDEKDEELIECDSLILSVGYYPEIDLIRSLNVDIKTINKHKKDWNFNENNEWIYPEITRIFH